MSVGRALQNIGARWSQSIADEKKEQRLQEKRDAERKADEALAKELKYLDFVFQRKLERERETRAMDEQRRLQESPEYQEELKRKRAKEDAELEAVRALTEQRKASATRSLRSPAPRGGESKEDKMDEWLQSLPAFMRNNPMFKMGR